MGASIKERQTVEALRARTSNSWGASRKNVKQLGRFAQEIVVEKINHWRTRRLAPRMSVLPSMIDYFDHSCAKRPMIWKHSCAKRPMVWAFLCDALQWVLSENSGTLKIGQTVFATKVFITRDLWEEKSRRGHMYSWLKWWIWTGD